LRIVWTSSVAFKALFEEKDEAEHVKTAGSEPRAGGVVDKQLPARM
jgi:hypothetical protein